MPTTRESNRTLTYWTTPLTAVAIGIAYGQPYSALGAVGGLAYVASLVWLRFRR